LKVGVATWEDASKLKRDLGIQFCGGYDVRHLIFRHPKRVSLLSKSGLSGDDYLVVSNNFASLIFNKRISLK
jgi:hypothetical protein